MIERGRFRGPRYAFRGDHLSLYQIARIVGVPAETFRRRVLKYGMTVEEAATAARRPYPIRKSRLYSLHGVTMTAKEAAQHLGLDVSTVYGRVSGDAILDGLDLIDPFSEQRCKTLIIRNCNRRAIKRISRAVWRHKLDAMGIRAITLSSPIGPIPPTITTSTLRGYAETFAHPLGTGGRRRETHFEGAS